MGDEHDEQQRADAARKAQGVPGFTTHNEHSFAVFPSGGNPPTVRVCTFCGATHVMTHDGVRWIWVPVPIREQQP